MAIRKILTYPDDRLRAVAEPIAEVDEQIRELADDMAETMYHAAGVGLAATQIGVAKRLFVIDVAGEDNPSQLTVFINPEITEATGTQTWNEGCLSFPGATEDIRRAARILIRAVGLDGKPFELQAEGLLAVAIQHEADHLDGVLMIDKVNALKRRLMGRRVAQAISKR